MLKTTKRKQQIIYVSHIQQEVLHARALKRDLTKLGYRVMLTPQGKSEKQVNHLAHRLMNHVDAVITLTSPAAARSSRIWADASYARLHNLPVIPMVVHEFENGVPMHAHIHAVDNFKQGVMQLKNALKRKKQYIGNTVAEDVVTPQRTMARKYVVPVLVSALTALAAVLP